PKGLADLPDVEYDVAVVMCADGCPGIRAKRREQWNIPVPKGMAPDQFREVRDLIGEKVRDLLGRLASEGCLPPTGPPHPRPGACVPWRPALFFPRPGSKTGFRQRPAATRQPAGNRLQCGLGIDRLEGPGSGAGSEAPRWTSLDKVCCSALRPGTK